MTGGKSSIVSVDNDLNMEDKEDGFKDFVWRGKGMTALSASYSRSVHNSISRCPSIRLSIDLEMTGYLEVALDVHHFVYGLEWHTNPSLVVPSLLNLSIRPLLKSVPISSRHHKLPRVCTTQDHS